MNIFSESVNHCTRFPLKCESCPVGITVPGHTNGSHKNIFLKENLRALVAALVTHELRLVSLPSPTKTPVSSTVCIKMMSLSSLV